MCSVFFLPSVSYKLLDENFEDYCNYVIIMITYNAVLGLKTVILTMKFSGEQWNFYLFEFSVIIVYSHGVVKTKSKA